jgi:general secretion pathway protein G
MATPAPSPRQPTLRLRPPGFTLLELMVVLIVLGLLASIAAPQVMKQLGKAKHQTAKVQVEALSASVDFFFVDVGRYPTQEEGLKALVDRIQSDRWDGPYLKKRESLTDPWGAPYQYRIPGKTRKYDIFTLGADQREGGQGDDADVGNW